MIWLIAKKDFLLNLLSVRFFIGFFLCLFIIPFTMIISVDEYVEKRNIYQTENQTEEEILQEAKVWSEVRPVITKEPEVLNVFSKGIMDNMGTRVKIYMDSYPLFPSGHFNTRDNPLLNVFSTIDFSRVIAILISLLALVFAYDSITRERENGTMKLNFTGQVSRISFLFGKLLGICLTILPILILCYLLACLVIFLNSGIAFSSSDWVGLLMLFISSIVYMLVFILIGMAISGMVKQSSSSIIICLLSWIWFLFLVPNIAVYLSQSIKKTPLYDNIEATLRDYDIKYNQELDQKSSDIKKNLFLEEVELFISGSFGGPDGMANYTAEHLAVMIYRLELEEFRNRQVVEHADGKWSIQKDYLDQLLAQKRIQGIIACLSPSEVFRQITEAICRTDVNAFTKYMENIRNYRESFIRFYMDNNILKSTSNFSSQRLDDLPINPEVIDTPAERILEMKKEEYNRFYFPLDITKLPGFIYSASDYGIQLAISSVALLLGFAVLLLLCVVRIFINYDIR